MSATEFPLAWPDHIASAGRWLGAPPDALARAFMRDAEGRPAGRLGMLFDIVLEASNAV